MAWIGATGDVTGAAATLARRRRHFAHRRFRVLASRPGPQQVPGGDGRVQAPRPPLAFVFPGQGSHYVGMGSVLHRRHPVFRETIDHCAAVLAPVLDLDIRDLLGCGDGRQAVAAPDERLRDTRIAQPLLFALGVALARLWAAWGVRPSALVGHSIGEYAAACVAGVMTLEDALHVVAARGRLMAEMPSGAMLSVRLGADALAPLLGGRVDLAAVNGPEACVAAGPRDAIVALEQALSARGVHVVLLRTSHAFHSRMMDPAAAAFERELARVRLSPPQVPIVSTVTGAWMSASEATDPGYWAAQLRRPVRFADALGTLWGDADCVALELGPRATATTLIRTLDPEGARIAIPSLGDGVGTEASALLSAVGQLWALGVEVSLDECIAQAPPAAIPGYPFARERHWVEPPSDHGKAPRDLRALLQAQMDVLQQQVALLERMRGPRRSPRVVMRRSSGPTAGEEFR
jgi:acyl transferase domain-containing protein